MNSLLSWVLPLLYFLISLVLTLVVGLACYALIRRLNNQAPDIVLAIGFLLGVINICLVLSVPLVFGFTMVLLVVCSMGTFAERAAYASDQSWPLVLLRMCLTTMCSVFLSYLLFIVPASYFTLLTIKLFHDQQLWFFLGIAAGMLLSPSVIPCFIWLHKSSRLRPGIERPLEDNDTTF